MKPVFPLPGKIILLPNEGHAKKVIVVSVEEHVGHCLIFFELLYGQLCRILGEKEIEILREAVLFHDVGKKLYRHDKLRRLLPGLGDYNYSDATKILLGDYEATLRRKVTFQSSVEPINITRVLEAYIELSSGDEVKKPKKPKENLLSKDDDGIETRDEVNGEKSRFLRPFGLHAYNLRREDFAQQIAEQKNVDIIYDLIRNHHRFQAESVVDNCARYGERFVHLLYGLITLDHLGSQAADEILRLLEEDSGQRNDVEKHFSNGVEFGSWVVDIGSALCKPNRGSDVGTAEERDAIYSIKCTNISTGEIVEGEFPITYGVIEVK